jgi:hypothetical protein
MITTTCKPTTARWWFKFKEPTNWAIAFISFLVLLYVLRAIFAPYAFSFIAAISIALTFVLFFFILDKRTIAVECPDCAGYIETNAPWKCGNPNCQKDNEQVYDFPIVYHCEHCGVEPKAFECPHCRKPIFLGRDQLKTIYARFVGLPAKNDSKPRLVKKDPKIEQIAKDEEDILETQRKIRKAKLDLELKGIKENLEPPKEMTQEEILWKSAQEYTDRNLSGPKIVARLRADAAERFKNDAAELEKANRVIDDWAKNHVDQF